MQVLIIWLVTGLVEVVADINHIRMSFTALKQLQLTILIPGVLVNAFDSDCGTVEQISSAVDQSKSTMSDYFFQAILLPVWLLSSRKKHKLS